MVCSPRARHVTERLETMWHSSSLNEHHIKHPPMLLVINTKHHAALKDWNALLLTATAIICSYAIVISLNRQSVIACFVHASLTQPENLPSCACCICSSMSSLQCVQWCNHRQESNVCPPRRSAYHRKSLKQARRTAAKAPVESC